MFIRSESSGRYRVGHSGDLDPRLESPDTGQSHYTARHGPWKLVHSEKWVEEVKRNLVDTVRPNVELQTGSEEQDSWGNSVANLRRNLKLTPLQRLRQADDMLRFVLRYKGTLRARNQP
jgi:hypothetical protein